jgi:GNAT superfamily N-acetyltransferase
LIDRIKRAKLIGVVLDAGKIIAVSAIKVPNISYRKSVFANADVDQLSNRYPYEMGWKVVLPEYRGKNLGEKLSKLVLQNVNQSKVFVTVRETNIAAITSSRNLGFELIGSPYIGSSGNKIVLLVKN